MRLLNRFWPFKHKSSDPEAMGRNVVFRAKYISFKELLTVNTELLDIISDVEEKLKERSWKICL